MSIETFMQGYKRAWETSDEHLLASLFAEDGTYHSTPFAVQRGREQIKQYWQRTKLQQDIQISFEILHAHAAGGIAHWRTTYQVTSEEMFSLWAASAGTNVISRQAGEPLPRLILDGVAVVDLDDQGLCRCFRIWWHAIAQR
jgi:ketosteroid isomerase-like protein